jgi:hypothetical protein
MIRKVTAEMRVGLTEGKGFQSGDERWGPSLLDSRCRYRSANDYKWSAGRIGLGVGCIESRESGVGVLMGEILQDCISFSSHST